MTRSAFITGITGQDVSCFTEFLFEKGCERHGLEMPCPRRVET